MSDDAEQQAEEVEVLKSIYEGDDNFKAVNSTTYQYKYVDGEKSFIMEISWGPTYPTEKPKCNLDIFYNQHLLGSHPIAISFMLSCNISESEGRDDLGPHKVQSVKDKILSIVDTEAEQWVGCAMTYTLFECLKERVPEILADQTEEAIVAARVDKIAIDDDQTDAKKPEKKEQLTKAQKRRAWDRAEIGRAGEKPRGWDWMDIVKHLSQAPHQPAS